MGLIRLLLALAVVGNHFNSNPLLRFVSGPIAVQAFFIISGFYMAMVHETYASKLDFWKSRYLRLYPTYIVCALLSLFLLRGGYTGLIEPLLKLPSPANWLILFSNATIFLQDLVMFVGINDGSVGFVRHYMDSTPPVFQGLLLPQGWSLSLELSFYLLVPFVLNKSTRVLLLLIFASLATRVALMSVGLEGDPWGYRFFPSELAMFLLGSLSFRVHRELPRWECGESIRITLLFAVLAMLAFFPFIPLEQQAKKLAFFALLTVSLGTIFDLTKNSKLDNLIGLLSYPIYCSHLFVLFYVIPRLGYDADGGSVAITLVSYLVMIAFAAGLYYLLEKPIDSYRARYKRRNEPSKSVEAAPEIRLSA